MRLSLRRIIVFFYLTICGLLSLINYRFSSLYSLSGNVDTSNNSTANSFSDNTYNNHNNGDDNNNNLHKRTSLFLELWQLITKKEEKRYQPTAATTSVGSSSSSAVSSSFSSTTFIPSSKFILWPEDSNSTDRILEQIKLAHSLKLKPRKLIVYLPHGVSSWNVKAGGAEFENCLANNCFITDSTTITYDAALHRNNIINTVSRTNKDQIWLFYSLESPENTGSMTLNSGNSINWTATYRYDSDIVTPYEKFSLYSEMQRNGLTYNKNNYSSGVKNYAKGKTKQVAWFVSNCFTNNDRMKYAQNLASFINVDIYGACGQMKCSRFDPNCFRMLSKDYKFYLAFENSNCRDYITEKFFYNGLQHDIIPIVMGAKKDDYERVAPPHSFIHVDDFETPYHLASYLKQLDNNDTLYNEYFRWKTMGEFVDTKFWCRLCSLLNDPKEKVYANLEQWWRGANTCVHGKWQNNEQIFVKKVS